MVVLPTMSDEDWDAYTAWVAGFGSNYSKNTRKLKRALTENKRKVKPSAGGISHWFHETVQQEARVLRAACGRQSPSVHIRLEKEPKR
jgi:hypothetical protein